MHKKPRQPPRFFSFFFAQVKVLFRWAHEASLGTGVSNPVCDAKIANDSWWLWERNTVHMVVRFDLICRYGQKRPRKHERVFSKILHSSSHALSMVSNGNTSVVAWSSSAFSTPVKQIHRKNIITRCTGKSSYRSMFISPLTYARN